VVDRSLGAAWQSYYGGLFIVRRCGAHDLPVLERLRRARLHLEAHAGEPLDLDRMAAAACYSKFHFLRLFRQAYADSPGRYLARTRLERARLLLETTGRSVTEICLDVGYESVPSFSAAFRKRYGMSPQPYRRRSVVVPEFKARTHRVPGCFLAMYA
jgi:transcriptional regulator GlxA family with amidase domain